MPTKTFEIKGTRYYQASSEVAAKRACERSDVRLQRDPSNQHDSNAVRVLLAQNGAFLGHVPRTMSAYVSEQILAGAIRKAHIRSIAKTSDYIEIKVTYEFDGSVERPAKPSPPSVVSAPFRVESPPTPNTFTPPSSLAAPRSPQPVQPGPTQIAGSGKDGEFGWGAILLVVAGVMVLLMLI